MQQPSLSTPAPTRQRVGNSDRFAPCGRRPESVERALFELLRSGIVDYDIACRRLGISAKDVKYMVYAMRKRGIRIDSYFAVTAHGDYIPRGTRRKGRS